MKILLVIPTVHGGGAEQVAAILSREWSHHHPVEVVAWHVGTERFDFGVPIQDLHLPAQPGLLAKATTFMRRVHAVRQIVQRSQPDAVMAFMDEAGLVCTAAAMLDGWRSRLVVSMHHNPRWLGPLRRLVLRVAYRFPAVVVGVSQGVREEMARSLALPQSRLFSIPNPLDPREGAGSAASQAVAASLPSGFLLFVGRLDRETKGLDTLIDAYVQLPEPRPHLVIVGDGDDRRWLEERIASLGLRDVRCVGWQTDPLPFYRRARVFVMSSRFEGWSNVLMEAMGQGCPVVATRCPYGPPEILGPEFEHLLVPVDRPDALARAIAGQLALDDAARRSLGDALRRRASRFAAPGIARRWIELARTLTEAGE